MVDPQNNVHVLIPRCWECDLFWKKGLCICNYVEDLEIRSSWIVWMGPKYNGKCPLTERRERFDTETHREGKRR